MVIPDDDAIGCLLAPESDLDVDGGGGQPMSDERRCCTSREGPQTLLQQLSYRLTVSGVLLSWSLKFGALGRPIPNATTYLRR